MWKLLKKLNIDLPYEPAISLLGIYLKECNSGYSKVTWSPMFIGALFPTAKLWKQPKCPSTDEWVKELWYVCTMEFLLGHKEE
jgi:hypothetical protein